MKTQIIVLVSELVSFQFSSRALNLFSSNDLDLFSSVALHRKQVCWSLTHLVKHKPVNESAFHSFRHVSVCNLPMSNREIGPQKYSILILTWLCKTVKINVASSITVRLLSLLKLLKHFIWPTTKKAFLI